MVIRCPLVAGLAAACGALVGAAAGAVVGFGALVGAAAGAVVGAAAGAVVGAAAGAAPPPHAARIAEAGILPSTNAALCSIWRREKRRVGSLLISSLTPPLGDQQQRYVGLQTLSTPSSNSRATFWPRMRSTSAAFSQPDVTTRRYSSDWRYVQLRSTFGMSEPQMRRSPPTWRYSVSSAVLSSGNG